MSEIGPDFLQMSQLLLISFYLDSPLLFLPVATTFHFWILIVSQKENGTSVRSRIGKNLTLEPKFFDRTLKVFFALVFTSLDQFRAPIETVSTSQSAALAATGFIWTRFCFTITPINYSLSICNFMLGLANGTQCVRAIRYQYGQKALTQGESEIIDEAKIKEL